MRRVHLERLCDGPSKAVDIERESQTPSVLCAIDGLGRHCTSKINCILHQVQFNGVHILLSETHDEQALVPVAGSVVDVSQLGLGAEQTQSGCTAGQVQVVQRQILVLR